VADNSKRRMIAVLIVALFSLLSMSALATEINAGNGRPAKPKKILVLGGTGQLGRAIIGELRNTPARITIFSRAGSDRTGFEQSAPTSPPVEWMTGDLLNSADVDRLFTAITFDIVINAVRVEDGDIHFYEKIISALTRNAKKTGTRLFIHHGAVGAGSNVEKFGNLGWERVPGIFDRLKDQGVGEELLRSSGVPYVIIRNARLYPSTHPATGKAVLTEDDGVLTPMTRADLARLTVECIDNPKCINKTFHVSDPSLPWPPTK
jgi:uncharacterized protein YbjT (DUF2867 family)